MNSRRHFISKVTHASIVARLPSHTLAFFANPIGDQETIIDAVEVVRVTGSYKSRPVCAELMFDRIWGGICNLPWPVARRLKNFGHKAIATERMESFVKTESRNCNPEE